MPSHDGSRLYPVAPGLYARSHSTYEQWQALNPDERAGYIEAASTVRPEVRDAPRQPPGRPQVD
jgi:hypothetical protein